VIVRAAQAEDAEALTEILNALITETTVTFTTELKTVENVQADIARRGAAFKVVEIDGIVRGLASYFPFRQGPGYARTQEHSIVLHPDAWGRGAGRALMAALEDEARAERVHSLIAGVSGENPAGRAFHAAIGFVEVGVLPAVEFKFGRWIDLVLMHKKL
jgi:phosphinothricin acetyltransferase